MSILNLEDKWKEAIIVELINKVDLFLALRPNAKCDITVRHIRFYTDYLHKNHGRDESFEEFFLHMQDYGNYMLYKALGEKNLNVLTSDYFDEKILERVIAKEAERSLENLDKKLVLKKCDNTSKIVPFKRRNNDGRRESYNKSGNIR